MIAIDACDAVPRSAEAYSGLVFMGGPMSVNDELPRLREVAARLYTTWIAGLQC